MLRYRVPRLIAIILLAVTAGAAVVWAFAEEPLTFRDPFTGVVFDEEVSTIHDDLSVILATAAGFNVTDAAKIEIWNQLVDSEQLGPGDAVSYTNCGGSFYPAPNRRDVCAAPLVSTTAQIWPDTSSMQDPERCFTSRFGVYSPFFHFPHLNGWEMHNLRDWGWGASPVLTGYEAYAWGTPADMTVLRANCRYTHTVAITTGVQAGSLEAFATYLHSLADAYSHRDCIAAMDALGIEWATHSVTGAPACNYYPAHPTSADVHGREFYTYPDSLRTDAAIRAVYSELVSRSLKQEGRFLPLDLNTVLADVTGTPTLSQALYAYVHTWPFSPAVERRAYGEHMLLALQNLARAPKPRIFLPIARR